MNPDLPIHIESNARALAPYSWNPALAPHPGRCLVCGRNPSDLPDHVHVISEIGLILCTRGRRCDRALDAIHHYGEDHHMAPINQQGPIACFAARILGPSYTTARELQTYVRIVAELLPDGWTNRFLCSLVTLRTLGCWFAAADGLDLIGPSRKAIKSIPDGLWPFVNSAVAAWRRRFNVSRLRGTNYERWDYAWALAHVARAADPDSPQHAIGRLIGFGAPSDSWLSHPPQAGGGRQLAELQDTLDATPGLPGLLLPLLGGGFQDRIHAPPRLIWDAKWGTSVWYSPVLGLHVPPLYHYSEDGYSYGIVP